MELSNLTPAQQNSLSSSSKDDILPLFTLGQYVRLKSDIKNDGTYAFAKVGEILVKAGEEGYVRHIGDFLQTIRIYEVDFIRVGLLIGCREFEIEPLDDGYNDEERELEWIREHRAKKSKD